MGQQHSVVVDVDKCIGCAQCYVTCPNKVFVIFNRKSIPKYQERCVGCRACVVKCPVNAISVTPRDLRAPFARFYE
ncbi:MAG: 4Fe-4S binding protein [Desulfurococcaceae archaeon]